MNKVKKFFRSPYTALTALILALALLAFAGIGSARAALIESATYTSRVSMEDIGVTLLENEKPIASRDYDSKAADGTWVLTSGELLGDIPETPVLGKAYDEALAVQNSGTIGEYVRMSIYRYWLDADGNKMTELSPDLIDIALAEGTGWTEDPDARTDERIVLYYGSMLAAGDTTGAATESVTISGDIATAVRQEKSGSTIKTIYKYDGVQFVVEATVDAVQEHNAQDAILSAWGRSVTVDEEAGTLSLN